MGFLWRVLCKWHAQATLIGKSVLPVLLLIRLVTLGAASQTAWLDDYQEFTCNTQEPFGECVCYNALTPLSLPHLWTLQLVLVLASGLVFLCYLIHLTNQETQVQNGEVKGDTLWVYMACMVFVILVEVGCNVVQWFLYGFRFYTFFNCEANYIPHRIECYIPRSQEKTAFMLFMLTTSCLSVLLNLVEAACVLRANRRWADSAKTLQSDSKVEESFLSWLLALWHSQASLLGKTVLPVLQLVRLVVVGATVQPLWRNELRDSVCKTMQPGCSKASYNKVFPLSLHQYWTLQVVFVLASGLIYFSDLVHLLVTKKQSRAGTAVKGQILGAYLVLLSAVVLLEAGFAVGQPLIFGLSLSTYFSADTMPCPNRVDCATCQATEKMVFLFIMLFLACLSGLLTLVEMCCVLKTGRPWLKRQNIMTPEAINYEMTSGGQD